MTTKIDICNLALQVVESRSIESFGENSQSAKQCNIAYDLMRQSLLQEHNWTFAIKRLQLAEELPELAFPGGIFRYRFPVDFIRLLGPDGVRNFSDRDWKREGQDILTSFGPPFDLRYVSDFEDANRFDPLFKTALAYRVAMQIGPVLNQSSKKLADAAALFDAEIKKAKKANAINQSPVKAPLSSWVTGRTRPPRTAGSFNFGP